MTEKNCMKCGKPVDINVRHGATESGKLCHVDCIPKENPVVPEAPKVEAKPEMAPAPAEAENPRNIKGYILIVSDADEYRIMKYYNSLVRQHGKENVKVIAGPNKTALYLKEGLMKKNPPEEAENPREIKGYYFAGKAFDGYERMNLLNYLERKYGKDNIKSISGPNAISFYVKEGLPPDKVVSVLGVGWNQPDLLRVKTEDGKEHIVIKTSYDAQGENKLLSNMMVVQRDEKPDVVNPPEAENPVDDKYELTDDDFIACGENPPTKENPRGVDPQILISQINQYESEGKMFWVAAAAKDEWPLLIKHQDKLLPYSKMAVLHYAGKDNPPTKENPGSIYSQLAAAGVPLDHHESDLYAKVTPASTAIVAQYEHRSNVSKFKSQVDGQMWYDIPFAYQPFWEAKLSQNPPVTDEQLTKENPALGDDKEMSELYRKSFRLALTAHGLTRAYPESEKTVLIPFTLEAAIAIPVAIANCGRVVSTRDKLDHLYVAVNKVARLHTLLDEASEKGYIKPDEYTPIMDLRKEVEERLHKAVEWYEDSAPLRNPPTKENPGGWDYAQDTKATVEGVTERINRAISFGEQTEPLYNALLELVKQSEGQKVSKHIANKLQKQFPQYDIRYYPEFSWYSIKVLGATIPKDYSMSFNLAYDSKPILTVENFKSNNTWAPHSIGQVPTLKASLPKVADWVARYNKIVGDYGVLVKEMDEHGVQYHIPLLKADRQENPPGGCTRCGKPMNPAERMMGPVCGFCARAQHARIAGRSAAVPMLTCPDCGHRGEPRSEVGGSEMSGGPVKRQFCRKCGSLIEEFDVASTEENPKNYEVRGFIKDSSVDDYENGEDPTTTQTFMDDNTMFSAPTQEALIKKLMDFVGTSDLESVLLWSDEPGRVDIQQMEDGEGTAANQSEIEAWKKGQKKLWAVTYTFQVQTVERKAAKLKPMPGTSTNPPTEENPKFKVGDKVVYYTPDKKRIVLTIKETNYGDSGQLYTLDSAGKSWVLKPKQVRRLRSNPPTKENPESEYSDFSPLAKAGIDRFSRMSSGEMNQWFRKYEHLTGIRATHIANKQNFYEFIARETESENPPSKENPLLKHEVVAKMGQYIRNAKLLMDGSNYADAERLVTVASGLYESLTQAEKNEYRPLFDEIEAIYQRSVEAQVQPNPPAKPVPDVLQGFEEAKRRDAPKENPPKRVKTPADWSMQHGGAALSVFSGWMAFLMNDAERAKAENKNKSCTLHFGPPQWAKERSVPVVTDPQGQYTVDGEYVGNIYGAIAALSKIGGECCVMNPPAGSKPAENPPAAKPEAKPEPKAPEKSKEAK